MFSASIVTLDERAAFIDLLAGRNGSASLNGGIGARGTGRELVLVRGGRVLRRTPLIPVAEITATLGVNLGALAAAFADRLRLDGDIPITIAQAERYETALALQTPRSRRALYYLTREVFVTDASQLPAFHRVFAETFGEPAGADRYREHASVLTAAQP
jgi:hypothetical protein